MALFVALGNVVYEVALAGMLMVEVVDQPWGDLIRYPIIYDSG